LEITNTYHNWQSSRASDFQNEYQDVPEFCYSASIDEIVAKDYSLVPSKYITFVNRDENIDFDDKMQKLKSEFSELLKAEAQSKNDLLTVFKELGYAIEL
jgi:type I restriction enzyme M protein